MQQPTDCGGVRRELPNAGLAAYLQSLQSPPCAPSEPEQQQEQQQASFSGINCPQRHPLTAAAAHVTSTHLEWAPDILPPKQQQQQHLPLSLSGPDQQAIFSGRLAGPIKPEGDATLPWCASEGTREARERLSKHDPSNASNLDRGGHCSIGGVSSNSSRAALVLPSTSGGWNVRSGQDGSLSFAGDHVPVPHTGRWTCLPAHCLPTPVEPWKQHEAPVAAADAAFKTAEAPISKPVGSDFPLGHNVSEVHGGSHPREESSVGGLTAGSCLKPRQEHQVLLQRLHQNEQMQRHILRNLQQQQQRWRHLLEACDGSAGSTKESNSAISFCSAVFPSTSMTTSSETASLVQGEHHCQRQIALSEQQFHGVTTEAVSIRDPMNDPQPSPAGRTFPQEWQRSAQPCGRQVWVPLEPSGLQPTTVWQASGSLQNDGPRNSVAADASETQAWSSEQQQNSSTAQCMALDPSDLMQDADATRHCTGGSTLQSATSWQLHNNLIQAGRTGAFPTVSDESLASGASVALTASELVAPTHGIHSEVAGDAAGLGRGGPFAYPGCSDDPHCIRLVKEVGRRRRGRRVAGKNKSLPTDVKCGASRSKADVKGCSSLQTCSRSPSVARTAACAVLGFGSGMPLQTKLAEVRTQDVCLFVSKACATVSTADMVFDAVLPLLLLLLLQNPTIGLVNLGGGSCFLNVVLQCLAHIQPLRDFYLHHSTLQGLKGAFNDILGLSIMSDAFRWPTFSKY